MNSDTSKFDQQVMNGICLAIQDATKNYLSTGYRDSPLQKLLDVVFKQREEQLKKLLEDALDGAFDDLKTRLNETASLKLAKILQQKFEGEIEKRANELRADPNFRARLTIAIDETVRSTTRAK